MKFFNDLEEVAYWLGVNVEVLSSLLNEEKIKIFMLVSDMKAVVFIDIKVPDGYYQFLVYKDETIIWRELENNCDFIRLGEDKIDANTAKFLNDIGFFVVYIDGVYFITSTLYHMLFYCIMEMFQRKHGAEVWLDLTKEQDAVLLAETICIIVGAPQASLFAWHT